MVFISLGQLEIEISYLYSLVNFLRFKYVADVQFEAHTRLLIGKEIGISELKSPGKVGKVIC
jgi:hypothetical protein